MRSSLVLLVLVLGLAALGWLLSSGGGEGALPAGEGPTSRRGGDGASATRWLEPVAPGPSVSGLVTAAPGHRVAPTATPPKRRALEVGPLEGQALEIQALEVRVLDRATGQPAPGVRVSLLDRQKKLVRFGEALGAHGVETDSSGAASLPCPELPGKDRPRERLLALEGGGYAPVVHWADGSLITEGGSVTHYVDRCAELRGRVAPQGPVSGPGLTLRLFASLTQWPQGAYFYGKLSGEVPIGAEGQFEIANVFPGLAFDAEIRRGEEVLWTLPEAIHLRSGELRHVAWSTALSEVRVHGREQDHGASRPFRVALSRVLRSEAAPPRRPRDVRFRCAYESGVATIEGVPQGAWRATVLRTDHFPTVPGEPVTVPAALVHVEFEVLGDGRAVDVDIPLHRGSYLTGSFELGPGLRVAEARLRATGDAGSFDEPLRYIHGRGRVDLKSQGEKFRLGPLPPGKYVIELAEGSDPRLCIHPAIVAYAGGDPISVRVSIAAPSDRPQR